MQDGDLDRFVKARAGQLLDEDTVMLMFVQICLAVHYIDSKVKPPAIIADACHLAMHHCQLALQHTCCLHTSVLQLFCEGLR